MNSQMAASLRLPQHKSAKLSHIIAYLCTQVGEYDEKVLGESLALLQLLKTRKRHPVLDEIQPGSTLIMSDRQYFVRLDGSWVLVEGEGHFL